LVVMMYVKYPLSLRNVEDLLFERGIDICHETVRLWCWVGRLIWGGSRCSMSGRHLREPFFSALDSGFELDCMTRLVAEPGPTYIRSAAC
jgi:hypothetical protein